MPLREESGKQFVKQGQLSRGFYHLRLFSQGHKVLIFSQMVRVLNIIEDFLRFKGEMVLRENVLYCTVLHCTILWRIVQYITLQSSIL